jgi:hypothetical protein
MRSQTVVLTDIHVAGYRDTVNNLVVVALRDVKTVLDSFEETLNPVIFRDSLVLALPEVLEPYCSAASVVAAQWFEQLRDLAKPSSPYMPTPGTVNIVGKAERLARYAVAPLFGQSDKSVFQLASGGVQRLIANTGRQTIHSNMVADPAPVRWARVARPGCCAFCGMLASRGAVYSSRETASWVTTSGVPAGGSKQFTSTFHNHCTCVPVPLHERQQISLPGEMERFNQAYIEASHVVDQETRQSGQPPSDDVVKTILAHMREILGTS